MWFPLEYPTGLVLSIRIWPAAVVMLEIDRAFGLTHTYLQIKVLRGPLGGGRRVVTE